ncbi:hypothetical protein KP509_33G014900 [Ceratopteris richardii]|uniref:Uncharacterized protein n=1 Tax=Ceratopteris richardii TaxID=49495 RepID=A0A8T2QNJ9_CERRI|nr:hypothetical protein KP509_33G014900 [Ceratopteris richardii]
MGLELVVSLRWPSLYRSSSLPPHRSLLENTCHTSRSRWMVVADSHADADGVPDRRYRGYVGDFNNQIRQHQHQQFSHQLHPWFQSLQHNHHQCQHHLWQGSSDIGQKPGKLGLSHSIALEGEISNTEKHMARETTNSCFFDAKHSSFPPNGDRVSIPTVCASAAAKTAGNLPLSLRMLKKKQQDFGRSSLMSGIPEVGNSLHNAFSSVVSMMKTLQTHTLQIRQHFFRQEIEGLINQVQREMHVSLLWLFEQIFACTPELMVLLMILLADFTAFSVANNLHGLPASSYTPSVSIISSISKCTVNHEGFGGLLTVPPYPCPSISDKADYVHYGGSFGNGGKGAYLIAGDAGGYPDDPSRPSTGVNKAPCPMDDKLSADLPSITNSVASTEISTSHIGLPSHEYTDDNYSSHLSATAAALAFQELSTADDHSDSKPCCPNSNKGELEIAEMTAQGRVVWDSNDLVLDQMIARSLVAPFTTKLEDDNYTCYDRTDLAYQYAIGNDSNNSLLLANYAQFLFLVRKDHDRAEKLFYKAVSCDPLDSEAISHLARFLWVARHNLTAAEKAFQSALQADPTNSFHAANYAHFLWNTGN